VCDPAKEGPASCKRSTSHAAYVDKVHRLKVFPANMILTLLKISVAGRIFFQRLAINVGFAAKYMLVSIMTLPKIVVTARISSSSSNHH
jgi:hypothetical protein